MDPRFKLMGSFSPLKAAEATERLVTECGALIRTPEAVQPQESPSTSRPEQEAPGGASLNTDITTLTSAECTTTSGCLSLLSGFNEATIELSEEKHVSGSKVEPLLKMLEQMLQEEMAKDCSSSGQRNGRTPLKAARREAPHTPLYEHHVIGNATGPQ
ncbi:hypothetical protein KUCAC02_016755, partial [Chaenocephalus aceratus]